MGRIVTGGKDFECLRVWTDVFLRVMVFGGGEGYEKYTFFFTNIYIYIMYTVNSTMTYTCFISVRRARVSI